MGVTRDPVTELTPAQAERLQMLAEEASEVIKVCMKILRHGYASHHPGRPKVDNRHLLILELMDFWTVYERMAAHNELPALNFYGTIDNWKRRLPYTHHQEGSPKKE